MPTLDLDQIINVWTSLEGAIFVPRTEEDYRYMVTLLDKLIDLVEEDEDHPFASLMEILGMLIEHYENLHVTELIDELAL